MTPADSGTAARRARREAQQQRPTTSRPGGSGPRPGLRDDAADDAPATGAPSTTAARRGGDLDPDALAALEEERDFLLRSLDDLEREHDAGDVDDTDYEALKDDYTARAATVIRAIEQRTLAFDRARRPRRRGRTLVWVAILLVASVALGIAVAQASGRREAGESVSGDIRQTSRDQLLDARVAYSNGDFVGAIRIYDEVLGEQPANVEALTYKGWLLYLTSQQAQDPADVQVLLARATELLDSAIQIDPSSGDARIFRATVLGATGHPDEALADLDAVPAGAIPEFMVDQVAGLRSELEAQAGGPSGSGAPTATNTAP